MLARDYLRLAGGALRGHARRTALSLLGVAVGVTAVIALTSVGESARRYVVAEFSALGSHVLAVVPGKVETTGGMPGFGGVPNDLTLADAQALQTALGRSLRVVPISMGTDSVSYRERSRQVAILGATTEMKATRQLRMQAGRFLPESPWDRGAPVAVLGQRVAEELFEEREPIGEVVRIGGWRMRVIGVLGMQGVHFGVDMDELVIIPVATGMSMFDRSSLFRVLVEARGLADLESTSEHVTEVLMERHGEEDFTVMMPDAMLDSLGSILDVLTLALAGIATISLAVAGIGIMNVMLVSVSERRKEISLLMALGARAGQITSLFLVEAVLLSAAGGLVGLACGHAIVRAAAHWLGDLPVAAPAWASPAALGMAVLIGAAFGVVPARLAVRVDPVVGLSGR